MRARDGVRRGVMLAALLSAGSAGCDNKKSAAPADPAPAPATASTGPRIMPAVAADSDQLLPEVPPGYTACTKDAFATRIDEKTADERAAAWQAEAAKLRPSLHRVDVRGAREDEAKLDGMRREVVVRFAIPSGELEIRLPGRVSIHAAPRAAQPSFERTGLYANAHDFVLAPLDKEARVMVGEGWAYTDKRGYPTNLDVDAYLVKESLEETTKKLTKHAEHALEATTCSFEEGWYQRGAYRVASTLEPDGSASILLGYTAGGHCMPSARWEELVVARRVADVTVVMVCTVSDEGAKALCRSALASAHLR